jgi:hypothetical protein
MPISSRSRLSAYTILTVDHCARNSTETKRNPKYGGVKATMLGATGSHANNQKKKISRAVGGASVFL